MRLKQTEETKTKIICKWPTLTLYLKKNLSHMVEFLIGMTVFLFVLFVFVFCCFFLVCLFVCFLLLFFFVFCLFVFFFFFFCLWAVLRNFNLLSCNYSLDVFLFDRAR